MQYERTPRSGLRGSSSVWEYWEEGGAREFNRVSVQTLFLRSVQFMQSRRPHPIVIITSLIITAAWSSSRLAGLISRERGAIPVTILYILLFWCITLSNYEINRFYLNIFQNSAKVPLSLAFPSFFYFFLACFASRQARYDDELSCTR